MTLFDGSLREAIATVKVSPRTKIFRVTLASGRSICAARHHFFLGAGSSISLESIIPGGRLPISRRLNDPGCGKRWQDHELILLGHLVGDGSYLKHAPLRYTTASQSNDAAVASSAVALGSTVKRYAGRGKWHQLLISGNGNRWHAAGVGKWLKELGLFGQRSDEKRLPAEVFELPDDQVALLLRHLWATDGCIYFSRPGRRGGSRIFFSTSSRALAFDVAALLLRFGIVARMRMVIKKPYRPCFTVDVSGAHQRVFLDRIGAFGPRIPAANLLRASLEGKKTNTNVDTLPIQATAAVVAAMARAGVTLRELAEARGTSVQAVRNIYSFEMSRALMSEFASAFQDPCLRRWSTSDIFWDRIISVAEEGEEETFEMLLPKQTAWLADGIANLGAPP